jgi:beta-glucanase (GH16 family)
MQTVNGVHEVAAFCPALPGSLSNTSYGNLGDLLGMRYSFSIRADKMAGYKGVPLLWPLSEKWPRDGEIDAPESDFTAQPAAFMHHQSGTGPNDEDYYNTPAGTSWQDWHTYTIEWVPGVRVDGWIDGVHWIHDTTRIPNTPMHLVMQFETSTDGVVPAASTQGNVQIAWLQVWKYVA